jgi:hypothetical protein
MRTNIHLNINSKVYQLISFKRGHSSLEVKMYEWVQIILLHFGGVVEQVSTTPDYSKCNNGSKSPYQTANHFLGFNIKVSLERAYNNGYIHFCRVVEEMNTPDVRIRSSRCIRLPMILYVSFQKCG